MSANDYEVIDKLVGDIQKEKQPFVRLEIDKKDAIEMFKARPSFACLRLRSTFVRRFRGV